ncbi:hypothetical protein E2C01_029123 [Portunus trituberculatus]|uniref:Uncharacterized protein n=1 Tax=Portunus trituberculatus TaxID=210409 RepID=A0A5B7EQN6_PORTR|nr:hypothetical protein [Portunus trituberculatus]
MERSTCLPPDPPSSHIPLGASLARLPTSPSTCPSQFHRYYASPIAVPSSRHPHHLQRALKTATASHDAAAAANTYCHSSAS